MSVLRGLLLIGAALALALLGLAVPAHLGAVDPGVLRSAGVGTDGVYGAAEFMLDARQTGPARLMAESLRRTAEVRADGVEPALLDRLDSRLAELERQQSPLVRWIGGPDPYVEQALRGVSTVPQGTQDRTALSLVASPDRRAQLAGFLENSQNDTVRTILATRDLTGLEHFFPATTAAGGPYESCVALTAMLVQGQHFPAPAARTLHRLAHEAVHNRRQDALRDLEDFYRGLLVLARRLDYAQLAAWTRTCVSLDGLERAAESVQHVPNRVCVVFAAIELTEEPSGVAQYLREHPGERGWQDLTYALAEGRGGIRRLLAARAPIYVWSGWLRELRDVVPEVFRTEVERLATRQPQVAGLLKGVLWLLAAMFGARAADGLVLRGEGGLAGGQRVRGVRVLLLAAVLVFSAVAVSEPGLFEPSRAHEGPRLVLKMIPVLENFSPKTTTMNEGPLDPVSLVVLLFFFLVQLGIYFICLTRLAHVRRLEAPPTLKLKLLENEEILFDLGLFVGIGGSIGSLILILMHIIEASLMAAYSSSLFGILFVALLKIWNVRPYRRHLIVEADRASKTPAPAGTHL